MKTAAIQFAVLLGVALTQTACPLVGGQIDGYTQSTIPPQTIQGGGLLGGLLGDLAGIDFPFSSTNLGNATYYEGTQVINIAEIGLRTLLPAGSDRTDASLRDDGLIRQCRSGQAPITWLHSMKIYISRPGDTSSERLLAHYDLDHGSWGAQNICGFFFEVDDSLNLKDFMPNYQLRVDATGSPPSQDTDVGGFATILYDAQVDLPQSPPQQGQ